MKINVDDELAGLAALAPSADPAFLRGACWALARLSGLPADVLERRVLAGAAPAVAPLAPMPAVPAVPAPPFVSVTETPVGPAEVVGDLGFYPGVGPIVKLPDPPTPADMTSPPAPPRPGSMADMAAAAVEAGDPAALPMDPETLAEVEAELAAIQAANGAARGSGQ